MSSSKEADKFQEAKRNNATNPTFRWANFVLLLNFLRLSYHLSHDTYCAWATRMWLVFTNLFAGSWSGCFLKCHDDSQCFGTLIRCTFFFFNMGWRDHYRQLGTDHYLINRNKIQLYVRPWRRKAVPSKILVKEMYSLQ